MWELKQLLNYPEHTFINGKWVPARPENFKPRYFPIWKRVYHAWQVIIGREETFRWPEGQ